MASYTYLPLLQCQCTCSWWLFVSVAYFIYRARGHVVVELNRIAFFGKQPASNAHFHQPVHNVSCTYTAYNTHGLKKRGLRIKRVCCRSVATFFFFFVQLFFSRLSSYAIRPNALCVVIKYSFQIQRVLV